MKYTTELYCYTPNGQTHTNFDFSVEALLWEEEDACGLYVRQQQYMWCALGQRDAKHLHVPSQG